MQHFLARSTLIPIVVEGMMKEYGLSWKEALQALYTSATGASLADDDTGLYGQSPNYILGLYRQEVQEQQETPYDRTGPQG